MKLKLLLPLILLALPVFGANTNQFNNILITGSFMYTGGAFGVGKVLTSDANGNYTPQTPSGGGGGGDVFSMSNNVFTAVNTFNTNTVQYERLLINTNAGDVNNSTVVIYPYPNHNNNYFNLATSVGASPVNTAEFLMGDWVGSGAKVEFGVSATQARLTAIGVSAFNIDVNGGPVLYSQIANALQLGDGGTIITFNSDSTAREIHTGITNTYPNGWIVNLHAPSTVIVTNIFADFPNIIAASSADIVYPVSGVDTNMVVSLGSPTAESSSLALNAFISSTGNVTLRAKNVGALAVDQANLPYRLQITVSPTANSQ